jgi:hypothetical protein
MRKSETFSGRLRSCNGSFSFTLNFPTILWNQKLVTKKKRRKFMQNFKLNYRGFKPNLVKREDHKDLNWGVQYVFRFENGYGASVIKHTGSYGFQEDLWELAVIQFDSKDAEDYEWELTYDTRITDDVIGWLTDKEVRDLLRKIKEL